MRISDWSSDVCSSDLRFFEITAALRERIDEVLVIGRQPLRAQNTAREPVADHQQRRRHRDRADRQQHAARSEERRVGKEVSVRVDLGGRRNIKKKKRKHDNTSPKRFMLCYVDK